MKTLTIPEKRMASPRKNTAVLDPLQQMEKLKEFYSQIKEQIERVIIGQSSIVDELLISLFSKGHCLLIGVPGLAKTLLISTLARILNLQFSRIQFTPDLMPSDITGTDILEEDRTTGKKVFRFVKGPVFSNIVLADEINRTPPKTQAALLQAMQEHEVSAGGATYRLEEPFFVLATQNPIEQEGTYPLPEAQLDRFMFNLWIDYPTENEEIKIVRATTGGEEPVIAPILDQGKIIQFQKLIRLVPVSDHLIQYAVNLARMTRPGSDVSPKYVKD
jgi:MoxR-like ATPase